MNRCPNCGAPITSSKCEYCDTVFGDTSIKENEYVDDEAFNSLEKELEELRLEYERGRLEIALISKEFDKVGDVSDIGLWITVALVLFCIICSM